MVYWFKTHCSQKNIFPGQCEGILQEVFCVICNEFDLSFSSGLRAFKKFGICIQYVVIFPPNFNFKAISCHFQMTLTFEQHDLQPTFLTNTTNSRETHQQILSKGRGKEKVLIVRSLCLKVKSGQWKEFHPRVFVVSEEGWLASSAAAFQSLCGLSVPHLNRELKGQK